MKRQINLYQNAAKKNDHFNLKHILLIAFATLLLIIFHGVSLYHQSNQLAAYKKTLEIQLNTQLNYASEKIKHTTNNSDIDKENLQQKEQQLKEKIQHVFEQLQHVNLQNINLPLKRNILKNIIDLLQPDTNIKQITLNFVNQTIVITGAVTTPIKVMEYAENITESFSPASLDLVSIKPQSDASIALNTSDSSWQFALHLKATVLRKAKKMKGKP